jgi:hypothetical protein
MLFAAVGSLQSQSAHDKTIGMQVGAVSFLDEGTEKVLDELQQDAAVTTLFMAAVIPPFICRLPGEKSRGAS